MTTLLASIVAVAGTLLGAVVAHFFQQRVAERSVKLARHEQVRQERLAAYRDFASALTEYRRSLYEIWRAKEADAGSDAIRVAFSESERCNSVADQALLVVKLLAGDAALVDLAEEACSTSREMRFAEDREVLMAQRVHAREAQNAFVRAASAALLYDDVGG